jgi:hypothetical protein
MGASDRNATCRTGWGTAFYSGTRGSRCMSSSVSEAPVAGGVSSVDGCLRALFSAPDVTVFFLAVDSLGTRFGHDDVLVCLFN